MYPTELRYSKEHEWAKVEGNRVRVGITQFAADRLSDVVYVELPKVGSQVAFMQPFGVVESVKAVSEIYAPASGEVIEANGELQNKPETINNDPHGAAWLIKVRLTNAQGISELMDAAAYEAYIAAKQKEASA